MSERELFIAALNIPEPAERAAWLDRECGGDAALRQRIDVLLRAFDQAGSLLENPALAVGRTLEESIPDAAGTVIGPYKLLQQIGEGGMGTVFMAEQTQPVQRKVALKIIKAGMDSRQVIARFEAERQALAMMDHVNIARVLDAGATESGLPYFVMELVHGVPFTQYCDDNHLTPRQRLELFVPVCQAIQHAHQKGIIHRDIKPSNVMITLYDGKPVPKVIDFGVAKATEQKLTERTLFTQYGTMVGTLEYMSPEQAEMSALGVDTRSDIYSLGVLLYELLTGSTPLTHKRMKEAAYAEILRMIKEEEPPRPSTRLSDSGEALASISAQRHMEPAKLTKLVRGELDWIAMKTLEKDRNRRYETANAFAVDVQRYLDDEPVQACPPSVTYRLRKFAKRNKGTLLAAAVVLLALVGGMVGTTWGLVEAQRRRDAAVTAEMEARADKQKAIAEEGKAKASEQNARVKEQEARASQEEARAVLEFFQDKVLAAPRPLGFGGGVGSNTTIRTAVDAAEPQIAQSFRDKPLVEASIRTTVATTYLFMGQPEPAIPQLERALALRKAQLGPEHPETLVSAFTLAWAYMAAGQFDKALPLHEQTLKIRRVKLGPEHADTLLSMRQLGETYLKAGRYNDAVGLLEETLKLCNAKLGPDNQSLHYMTMMSLAYAYQYAGRLNEALDLFEMTLRLQQANLGPDNPDTLYTMPGLGAAYQNAGRLNDALTVYRQALELQKAKLGPEHRFTLNTMAGLANAYQSVGRPNDGLAVLEEALNQCKAKLGPEHVDTLYCMRVLGETYLKAGRYNDAVGLLEETLKLSKAKLGPDNQELHWTMHGLAWAYADAGRGNDAIKLYEETLGLRKAKLGMDHPDTLTTMGALGGAYWAAGGFKKAIPLLEETVKLRKARLGQDHPHTLDSMYWLARAYQAAGRLNDAIMLYEETLKLRKAKLGQEHPDTLTTMSNLIAAYTVAGRHKDAVPLHEETVKLRTAKLGQGHADTLSSMSKLAEAYKAADRPNDAVGLYEQVLKLRQAKLGPDHPGTFESMNDLANAYWRARRYNDNVAQQQELLRLRQAKLGPDHPDTLFSMNALGGALQGIGRLKDALPVFEETLKLRQAKLGSEHALTLQSMNQVAQAYENAGQLLDAEAWWRELAGIWKQKAGADSPQHAHKLAAWGLNLLKQHKFADAEPILRDSLAIRTKKQPNNWQTFDTKSMLGASLLGQKKNADAEPLLLEGYEGLKQRADKLPAQQRLRLNDVFERLVQLDAGAPENYILLVRLSDSLDRMVQLYGTTGRQELADKWRKKLETSKAKGQR